MLGRLEMDVDECIKAYKALMRSVFEKKKHIVSLSLRGVIKPRFSSEVLEKAIKNVIETCRAPGQEAIPVDEHFYLKSQDEDSRRCKVYADIPPVKSHTSRLTCSLDLSVHRGKRPGGSHV